jgi:hypothetical protein
MGDGGGDKKYQEDSEQNTYPTHANITITAQDVIILMNVSQVITRLLDTIERQAPSLTSSIIGAPKRGKNK